MNEQEVIRAILNGDTRQFEEIVDQYQQIVANLCYKYSGNKLDTEEITQQVFVELYSSLPRFRFDSKLSTFIYRIAVNVICKSLEKERRYVRQPDEQPEQPSTDRNIEQQLIYSEQHQELKLAIAQLKHEQRTALILYTYNDFSYNDIAEVMQCSLSKVETLIFRAKKNLATILKNKKQNSKNNEHEQ
ncbi:MAG: RNA polymerase sigma factor [Bacteroidales bacterium]|nr:RNA polymerase sigma factor [Bacteroidales bacterium]